MAPTRTAVAVAVASAAVALWAAPYWLDVARHAVQEQRWPDDRARIEAVVAAIEIADAFTAVPCDDAARTDVDRCWRTTASPEESVAPLTAALTAAGVADAAPIDPPAGGDMTMVLGTVRGRQVWTVAAREVDPGAQRVEDMFTGTVLVRLTADLEAP